MEPISIGDFKKVEITVGEIVSAEKIEGSDKLLKLKVNFGTEGRQVLSGIAAYFPDPNELVGKRVAFATLNMTVQEEYQAKLQSAPPSTASKFRNAAVDGYNTVVEGFIDVGLFALSAGPSLLIWIAILFFPARWAWRKWKKGSLRQNHEETEGNTK